MSRIISFTIERIEVEVPSATTAQGSYRVVFAGAHPARCQCAGYAARKGCRHQGEASNHIFSEDGLYESLEFIDAQLGALPRMAPPLGCYHHAALCGLRDEIERRLREIEPPAEMILHPATEARDYPLCPDCEEAMQPERGAMVRRLCGSCREDE